MNNEYYFPKSEHVILSACVCIFTTLADVHCKHSDILQITGELPDDDEYIIVVKDYARLFYNLANDNTVKRHIKAKFIELLFI